MHNMTLPARPPRAWARSWPHNWCPAGSYGRAAARTKLRRPVHAASAQPAAGRLDRLTSAPTAQAVLDGCGEAWPQWANNAYRLLREGGSPVPGAPNPGEAAAALKTVAKRALKLPPAQRGAALSRHRVVLGLLECLRVQPARGPPSGRALPGSTLSLCSGPAPSLTAQELSGAIWSLGVLGRDASHEAEMEALCALLPSVRFDSLQQVADVCWALGVARHWSPHLPLLEQQAAELVEGAVAETAAGGIPQGASSRGGRARVSHSQLSNTAWGLVALGHAPTRLLGTLPGVLRQWHRAEEGGAGREGPGGAPHSAFPSLCTLAWCAAAAGQLGPGEACSSLLGALARSAEALTSQGAAPPAGAAGGAGKAAARAAHAAGPAAKQAMQLHQVALALALSLVEEQAASSSASPCSPETLGSNVGRALAALGLPPEAASTLQGLFTQAGLGVQRLAGDRRMQQVSACQADVVATLLSLGLPCQEEHQVLPGLLVDALVPHRLLAVEVDGPTHFTRNLAPLEGAAALHRRPVGATLLKRRLLERAGWRVVQLDTAAWEQLRGEEQKRAFLSAAIAEAGAAARAV